MRIHTEDNPTVSIVPALMIVNSPWGPVQYRRMMAPGVVFVETASHGGAFVTEEAQQQIPEAIRSADRFYEEDCEIAAVIVTWPAHFTDQCVAAARQQVESRQGFNFRGGRA